jgi:hypothetical protein
MELSCQDATDMQSIQLVIPPRFEDQSLALFSSVPDRPQCELARSNISQLCKSLSNEHKLILLKEMLTHFTYYTHLQDIQYLPRALNHLRWFLSGSHGRTTLIVMIELWNVLHRTNSFSNQGRSIATQALVPELVQHFYVDGCDDSSPSEEFSYNKYVDYFLQHSHAAITKSPWKQTWDDSVASGRTAYSAQLVPVLLSRTPLPTVLVTLIIHLVV